MTGAERIAAERQRQIDVEGYDAAHDDQEHADGDLLEAADCYLECAQKGLVEFENTYDTLPGWWPWAARDWKPSPDPIRNLEKAGALIAAEIDRLLRARGKGGAA